VLFFNELSLTANYETTTVGAVLQVHNKVDGFGILLEGSSLNTYLLTYLITYLFTYLITYLLNYLLTYCMQQSPS